MFSRQGKLVCTPQRSPKCPLVLSDGNSCKRNIFQDSNLRNAEVSSGEESDLGPMSPLALTDRSPSIGDSSSGREFISPFASPERSSNSTSISWDRLTSKRNAKDHIISPFSSLKKITRTARYSPRCKLFSNNSPKSLNSSPIGSIEQLAPQHSKAIGITMNEIVPETPQRNFPIEMQNQRITETPKKIGTPERRQITPLNSITKTAPLPKLHRRKSLCTLETRKSFSSEQKENSLKRRANDQLITNPIKLFKTDNASVSKARVTLFQERKSTCHNPMDIALSTKTFYNNNAKTERPFISDNFKNNNVKKRRNLLVQNGNRRSLLKKQKFGKINAGVSHGIKKPKPKTNSEVSKKETRQSVNGAQDIAISNKSPSTIETQLSTVEAITSVERVPSPVIDENKRFFKTNRTIRPYHAATVTVNNKIKLKVTDGKIVLNQKRVPSVTHKQQIKAMNVSLDLATDLTVDEPEIEGTLEQDKVADLLKILEDDWGNDDYDTMEALDANVKHNSPIKSLKMQLKETIMSPATELSNMTSTMNIKDGPLTNFGNLSLSNTDNSNNIARVVKESTEKEYFPLFVKGYSDNISGETDDASTSKTAKKNLQWQLSAKGGGAENQYQLDAGQKSFGATQCSECNIVYQLGDPEDENAHLNYHNSIRILKFQGWKNERIIMEDPFTSSRIILVEPHDPKLYWKKVSEILAVVDRDLGLVDMPDYENKKIFLYIREKNVLGVLVAEPIKTAYHMIPELIELNCCTSESTPTKCGINVVWTAMSHRRQGIATKLVDILRSKFFYGYIMSLDDIAFSIPTPSGRIFAEKYTKMRNFKVY